MWRRILNIVLMILAWGAVLAYILYASSLTRTHSLNLYVKGVEIRILDSTATSRLTTSQMVEKQLKSKGYSLVGERVDSINFIAISELLERNGFVERADVYASLSGVVHIDIAQRKPIVRLRSARYNSYMTSEGDIFCAPQGSAYHTPVITGQFRLITPPTFNGSIHSFYNEELERLHKQSVDGQISKGERWQTSGEYREWCRRKKRLERGYADLLLLAEFIEEVGEDDFWQAEIVQIVADTTSTGALSLRLIPRSGGHTIEFGELKSIDTKMARLEKFYEEGLPYLGWDRFKRIDIRYDKQVICRE